jgi:signal transduction histidine kinase
MGWSLDRREGQGRRGSDVRDTLAVRGLLHDLGHELTTLSYLIHAVRDEPVLPGDSDIRMELVSLEISRLIDIVTNALTSEAADPVDIRAMASQITRLASAAYGAHVVLLPGPAVSVQVNPSLLWRALTNVIDNATRAAGQDGRVDVVVGQAPRTFIDVIDDGPGFGNGPPGVASLGLRVATSLLESCGGALEVHSPTTGGTRVRIALPGQGDTDTRAGAGRVRGRQGGRVGDERG